MIASQRIDATIGGVSYVVNPGENIPPGLAAYWDAAGLTDKARAACVEPEPQKATVKTKGD